MRMVAVILTCAVCVAGNARAGGIPEPGAIVHGQLLLEGVPVVAGAALQVEARLGAEVLASYALGDEAQAGDLYLLQVPLSASAEGIDARPRRNCPRSMTFAGPQFSSCRAS